MFWRSSIQGASARSADAKAVPFQKFCNNNNHSKSSLLPSFKFQQQRFCSSNNNNNNSSSNVNNVQQQSFGSKLIGVDTKLMGLPLLLTADVLFPGERCFFKVYEPKNIVMFDRLMTPSLPKTNHNATNSGSIVTSAVSDASTPFNIFGIMTRTTVDRYGAEIPHRVGTLVQLIENRPYIEKVKQTSTEDDMGNTAETASPTARETDNIIGSLFKRGRLVHVKGLDRFELLSHEKELIGIYHGHVQTFQDYVYVDNESLVQTTQQKIEAILIRKVGEQKWETKRKNGEIPTDPITFSFWLCETLSEHIPQALPLSKKEDLLSMRSTYERLQKIQELLEKSERDADAALAASNSSSSTSVPVNVSYAPTAIPVSPSSFTINKTRIL